MKHVTFVNPMIMWMHIEPKIMHMSNNGREPISILPFKRMSTYDHNTGL